MVPQSAGRAAVTVTGLLLLWDCSGGPLLLGSGGMAPQGRCISASCCIKHAWPPGCATVGHCTGMLLRLLHLSCIQHPQ